VVRPVSRLSNLRRDELDERGQQVWDAINAGRGAAAVRADGGLAGPFNAWVHAPDVGARLLDLGSALRFGTSIDRRLLELAIITVAAHWKAEFEWWAHARMAREQGVDKDIIEAIGRGGPVQPSRDDERIVHAAALQLVAEGKLAASTYQEAYSLLGDQAMVELVSLCGYYSLVSYVLNAFEVPLPPDVPPRWDEGTVSEERASP
jgi:4-carboxymuconolactone decarboxylase